MHKEIGIDLGSMNMSVSTAEEGIIARAPSYAAITREASPRLCSVGDDAIRAEKDAPETFRLIRPLQKGLVADDEATRYMLSHLIRMTCGNLIIHPRVILGIPFNLTEEQENVLEWTANHAGARETFLVYSPVAALAGMEIQRDAAVLIVDIGASQTSIMLTGGARILYKNTVTVGGDSFDAAIANYLNREKKIRISGRQAEIVKKKIGSVWISREDRYADIRGRDAVSGESVPVRVTSREMFDALEEPMAALLAAVCEAIAQIPTRYVGDIFHRGILLCGGGSLLDGLDKMISGVTGVNARVVQYPSDVVGIGLGRILSELPTSMKNEKLNISMRYLRAGI